MQDCLDSRNIKENPKMSNNDVADIQATLKNIGVEVTPEQIEKIPQTRLPRQV